MSGQHKTEDNPWRDIDRLLKHRLTLLLFIANLTGACIVTVYFSFFDKIRPIGEVNNVAMIVLIMFVCLTCIASRLEKKWSEDLNRFIQLKINDMDVRPDLCRSAQRKILNLPYIYALISFITWCLASLIMSVYTAHSILNSGVGEKSNIILFEAFRTFVGVILSGIITCAIIFFTAEAISRKVWPYFFPQGGLAKTPGAIRLNLRIRMFAIFILTSVMPMVLMAVLSYNKAKLMLVMNPEEVIRSLFFSTAFLLAVVLAMALILSHLFSTGIVNPVQQMKQAMAKVESGDLSATAPVINNDELGVLSENFNRMTEGLKEREVIKDAFGKYVAEEVRDEILSGRIALDGDKKDVTVLFSDLRDFTPMTESHDPKLVVKIMNSYFKEMAEAIRGQGGLVLQFIGDEIYAVFGAPVSRPDHPQRAFRAGLEMRQRLVRLNRDFEKKNWPGLRHGIGVHTGEAIAANIGSPDRQSYLLVGDTVCQASRIQSLTKEVGAEMVISVATHTRLTETERTAAKLTRLPPTMVKGKKQPVEIFSVA